MDDAAEHDRGRMSSGLGFTKPPGVLLFLYLSVFLDLEVSKYFLNGSSFILSVCFDPSELI